MKPGKKFTLLDTKDGKFPPSIVWTVLETIKVAGDHRKFALCKSSLSGNKTAMAETTNVYAFPA